MMKAVPLPLLRQPQLQLHCLGSAGGIVHGWQLLLALEKHGLHIKGFSVPTSVVVAISEGVSRPLLQILLLSSILLVKNLQM